MTPCTLLVLYFPFWLRNHRKYMVCNQKYYRYLEYIYHAREVGASAILDGYLDEFGHGGKSSGTS